MNVMNVFVAEVNPTPSPKMSKGKSARNVASFHTFLQAGQSLNQASKNVTSEDDSKLTHIADILQSVENDELRALLSELLNNELTSLEDLELSEEELMALQTLLKELEIVNSTVLDDLNSQIEQLLIRFNEISNDELTDPNLNPNEELDETNNVEFNVITQVDLALQNEMMQLIGEINRIISEADNNSLKEKASELLPLLRQWTALKGQTEESEANRLITDELSEKNATIWKQLVNVFEKRSYFTESNMYRSDSAITRNDVMNWLEQAFNRYEPNVQTERTTAPVIIANQPVLMSEVQQHTIHVNSLDRVDRVSDEILSKFSNIVRESRFMTNNNLSQLSITLRPDNLGNMIVRFTQIDGEMAVKIIVSSQAAKSMLESNVHQLKHMFSPHQVVIERNEAISDEEFFGKDEELEEHEEETLKDGEDSRENNDNDAAEFDFSEIFQQFQQSSEEELENDNN